MSGCQWQCDILYSLSNVKFICAFASSVSLLYRPPKLLWLAAAITNYYRSVKQAYDIYLLAWHFPESSITDSACGFTLWPLQRCFV